MENYLNILLLAVVVVYVVDLSGFTTSWRSALARWIGTREESLRALPPFDCGKCAVFWAGVVYALAVRCLDLPVLAYVCLLSFLSAPIGQALLLVREAILKVIRNLMSKL